jgi:D-alanyl-D-alanine-carboxypeptidase/D-alanyl-D-alanine-endopeptidase
MLVSFRTRVLVSFVIASAAAGVASPAPGTIKRLDGTQITEAALSARIEELVTKAHVHGLAISIFNNREPVYTRTFGVKRTDTNEPLQNDTVFYGASLSKAVFGVLVMKLVEEGVIDLDTPLHTYLEKPLSSYEASSKKAWHENLKDLASDPRHLKITARMCLNHTTGFPNWRWFEKDQKLRINFEPGSRYSYSGEGMTFLQVVLERKTKRTLEDLMREKIFIPYGMTTSSYTWQPRFEKNFCHGHDEAGKVLEKDKDNAARAPSTLETTAEDYTRFLRAVLNHKGLQESSWKQLFSPQIQILSKMQFGPLAAEDDPANAARPLSYGLGWGIVKTPHGPGVFKEGNGEGFEHYSILFPDAGIGVLLMTNSANGESIFRDLLELSIADTYTDFEWQGYPRFGR